MRGYGDSEKPEDVSAYKIDHLIEDIRQLIRALGNILNEMKLQSFEGAFLNLDVGIVDFSFSD